MSNFDVNAIIQNADLRQLVEKAGGQPDQHGRCSCPIHGGNNENGFSIFHKDGRDYWKCWTGDCGAGDAIDFVKAWQGIDFKNACAFLGGDITSDPIAMEKSAQERLAKAKADHEETRLKVEARRAELQVAQMHLHYHNEMKQWGVDAWLARGIDESYQGLWTLGACDNRTIKYTDAKIAETIGKTRQYVSNYRTQLGIKPVSKWSRFIKLLGVRPDKEIAKIIGVTTGAVVRKRLRMGVRPVGSQRESMFQKFFSASLDNPEQYVRTEYGIIDVLTEDAIYELKPVLDLSAYQRSIGQLLIYKNAFPKKHLYIVSEEIKISENAKKTAAKHGIQILHLSSKG